MLTKVKSIKDIPCLLITDDPQYHNPNILHELSISASLRNDVNKSVLFNAIHASCYGVISDDDVPNIFSKSDQANHKGSSLNILIAEDNPTNQLVISKILEKAGHSVSIVENGQDALDSLESTQYDLIIMDMQMPVMGGIEAAKIYNFTTTPELRSPIIILTANATTGALKECEAAKVDAYLTKPIEARVLINKIHELAPHATNHATFNKETTPSCTIKKQKRTIQSTHIINLSTLEILRDLSPKVDFLPQLINGFIADADTLLIKMEHAIASKDNDVFLDHVHALKGSSGSIGATALHDLCSSAMNENNKEINHITCLKNINACYLESKESLVRYLQSQEQISQEQ